MSEKLDSVDDSVSHIGRLAFAPAPFDVSRQVLRQSPHQMHLFTSINTHNRLDSYTGEAEGRACRPASPKRSAPRRRVAETMPIPRLQNFSVLSISSLLICLSV
jgi:hypothetical protein